MSKIRLLIADDHPAFLEGLSRLLADEKDLECIAKSEDGVQAVQLAKELQPDVAVIDVSMPNLNGIEAIKKIKTVSPGTVVLMISAFDYESYILASLQAGAAGYMLKTRPLHEIIGAIRLVYSGDRVLDTKVADKVVSYLRNDGRGDTSGTEYLHSRELEIIRLTAEGLSNKKIANELYISERTVQTHLVNIFRKLGVNSRTQAVLYALKKGWINLNKLS
ncbi:MAG: response regulator transcription factor [Dehalococcoidales bacterium]|nr:response regulator transcription factor [Dehalococcoidales bacterium]